MAASAWQWSPRAQTLQTLAFVSFCACSLSDQSSCTDAQLAKFPGWPQQLDASVYWTGPEDELERATGLPSQFYDPKKPTVILIQGWDGKFKGKGGVETCQRYTSKCTANVCSDGRILAKPWIERGWNFGIFYWDQFSDWSCPRVAELKIWLNPNEGDGLEWKSYDPQTDTVQVKRYPAPSVGHVCAAAIRDSMPQFTGPTFRVLGHSFGGQLAAACVGVLHKETPAHPALPTRLVLLDPYFTLGHQGIERHFWCGKIKKSKNDLGYGRYGPLATANSVKELWRRGVVTELHKGSFITLGPLVDQARELETLATFVIMQPLFCPPGFNSCSHCSLLPLYTQRIADPPPSVTVGPLSHKGSFAIGNCTVPGPRCSDEEIRSLIERQNMRVRFGEREVWRQISGSWTLHTSDNTFIFQIMPVLTPQELKIQPVLTPSWPAVPPPPASANQSAQPAGAPTSRWSRLSTGAIKLWRSGVSNLVRAAPGAPALSPGLLAAVAAACGCLAAAVLLARAGAVPRPRSHTYTPFSHCRAEAHDAVDLSEVHDVVTALA